MNSVWETSPRLRQDNWNSTISGGNQSSASFAGWRRRATVLFLGILCASSISAGQLGTNSEVLTAIPIPAASTNTPALDDKHKLAAGDRLSFRINEDLEEPKAILVTDCGEVDVPYLGRVTAENKTCHELAREIKAALEKEYYYHATVIIAVDLMTKSRGRIYLMGPIRSPGPQEIPSDEVLTLSKAILRAGGFTDFADRHNVKVTRPTPGKNIEKLTFVVDVVQILEKGNSEKDLPLLPGDLIFVPERLVRF